MFIICEHEHVHRLEFIVEVFEHVHRLEFIVEVFYTLGRCGNVASVPKAPFTCFISYSRISYFGHAWPKLNFVLNYSLS